MPVEIEKIKPARQELVFSVTTEYLQAVQTNDSERIKKAFEALKELQDE